MKTNNHSGLPYITPMPILTIDFYWEIDGHQHRFTGTSLFEIANQLADIGYGDDEPHITVYDPQGNTVGWVGVQEDGSPYWRSI